MSSYQTDFETLYLERLGAQRQVHPSQAIWERLTQPTAILSGVILLVSILYTVLGSPIVFDEIYNLLRSLAWDTLVYLTPSLLLDNLDAWLNPQLAPRPMLAAPGNSHAAKSATLRRVLGVDRASGMMASVFQARSRALSMTGSALGLKLDAQRPPGLGNRDNSCFQNSIIQGLAALQPLPGYLANCLQLAEGEGADNENGSTAVTQILRSLLSDLNDPSNNGRTLWTPSKLKFMSTWTQQDAQEYYSKILDDIDKGATQALKALKKGPGFEAEGSKDDASASQHSDDSGYQSLSGSSRASDAISLRNPLEGLLAQRVACVQCGHSDGLSMIPFNCLTLSLGLGQGQHDLYERLDAYSNVESIEGVECPKCTLLKAQRLLTKLIERMREAGTDELAEPLRRLEAVELALEEDDFDEKTISEKCRISSHGKVTTTKTKQIVIARPPQSLAIHMNRSVFDPNTFNMIKNSAPVQFPRTLDLGPWCLGSADSVRQSADGTTGALNRDDGSEEEWLTEPRSSMVAGDLRPSRLTGPIYELKAAVTHAGRHENGHYICYRRFPRSGAHGAEPTSRSELVDDGGDVDDKDPPTDSVSELSNKTDVEQEKEMDWWRLSDHNVSRVDEETISSLAPGVFMLFYDCIDPTMVLQEEVGDSPVLSNTSSEPPSSLTIEEDVRVPATLPGTKSDVETSQVLPKPASQELVTSDIKPITTTANENETGVYPSAGDATHPAQSNADPAQS
jgi:ubiquitin carboxyl-terminal hydrolase 1